MQPRTVSEYIEPIEQVADSFIKRIDHLSKNNEENEMPSDFDMELSRWALESISYVSLGKRLGQNILKL